MNASSPDFALSFLGLLVLVLFICVLATLHVFVAKKKALYRGRYFLILLIVFFATLFVPVFDGAPKFGWIPVGVAYLLIPHSIFHSTDDLAGIFGLCYAVIAAQQLLSIGIAHVFTPQKKRA